MGEAGQDQGCSSGLWGNAEGGCRGRLSCSVPGARHRGAPGKEVLNECTHDDGGGGDDDGDDDGGHGGGRGYDGSDDGDDDGGDGNDDDGGGGDDDGDDDGGHGGGRGYDDSDDGDDDDGGDGNDDGDGASSELLLVAGSPQHPLACRPITPVSALVFIWPSPCVCLSLFSLLVRTQVTLD